LKEIRLTRSNFRGKAYVKATIIVAGVGSSYQKATTLKAVSLSIVVMNHQLLFNDQYSIEFNISYQKKGALISSSADLLFHIIGGRNGDTQQYWKEVINNTINDSDEVTRIV